MALLSRAQRVRVHLPVVLAEAPDPLRATDAITATCTSLSSMSAQLTGALAPRPDTRLWLTVELPNRSPTTLRTTVVWSQITTAPALLCGDVDRALDSVFEVRFEPGKIDLTSLAELMESKRLDRTRRARRIVRRAGIGSWQFA